MDNPYDDLATAVLDELSVDIYSPYKSERYFLTPEVQRDIVIALITTYFAGFFGLERLGEQTRIKLLALVDAFRSRRIGLATYVDAGELVQLFDEARRHMVLSDAPTRESLATAELARALQDYGMDAQIASEHAAKLSALFIQEMNKGHSDRTEDSA